MVTKNRKLFLILIAVFILGSVGACNSAGPEVEDQETSTVVEEEAESSSSSEESSTIVEATVETVVEERATSESEAEADPESESDVTAAEEEEEIPESQADGMAELAEEQILVLSGGVPPTLDPHLSGDATSAEYVVEIFSGLMVYDPDLNLIPDVAESYEVSEDGLVYTFKLRENAQFHDGKPIRAEDFKWSFERACDPATQSHTAETYLGDIVGCRSKLAGDTDEVEGVVAVDDLTLELTIQEPINFFLAKMTYPTAYVLDQENVEAGGEIWFLEPNGSGPFMFEELDVDNNAIILTKNDHYYRDPQPTLERVIYLMAGTVNLMTGYEQAIPAPITESLGLSQGKTFDAIPVGIEDLSRVTDPNNPLSEEFVSTEALSVFYVGFNVEMPPFDDVNIRQAFSLAVDKRQMVKLIYRNAVPVANGIVPPNMPNYENPDLSDYEFDPERALNLIAESSYGDVTELPEITLSVGGTGGNLPRIIESLVDSYKENLGIEVFVEQSPWPEFLQDLNSGDSQYHMHQLGWIADYPDPQNFLEVLFHSESRQNHGQYSNLEVDALLEEARVAQDSEERMALYQEAEQMILDDAAWVPIYFEVESWLVKPYVQNFKVPPLKVPYLYYVSIAEH